MKYGRREAAPASELTREGERTEAMAGRLRDYESGRLLDIARHFDQWEHGWDWCHTWDFDDWLLIASKECIADDILDGLVTSRFDLVRDNGEGRCESVSIWELEREARERVPEIARCVVRQLGYMGECPMELFYQEEQDVLEAWKRIDEEGPDAKPAAEPRNETKGL